MNNLGGWKKVELLLLDEVEQLLVSDEGVKLVKSSTSSRVLPLHKNGVSLLSSAKVDNNGCLYAHTGNVELRSSQLTIELQVALRRAAREGCILIGTTNNDEKRVLGDLDTPLTGTFTVEHGKSPGDLHHHVLSVSTSSIHPELPLL